MAETEDEILTLDEVAACPKAGKRKRAVYRLAAEGKPPGFRLGGVRGASVEAIWTTGLPPAVDNKHCWWRTANRNLGKP